MFARLCKRGITVHGIHAVPSVSLLSSKDKENVVTDARFHNYLCQESCVIFGVYLHVFIYFIFICWFFSKLIGLQNTSEFG